MTPYFEWEDVVEFTCVVVAERHARGIVYTIELEYGQEYPSLLMPIDWQDPRDPEADARSLVKVWTGWGNPVLTDSKFYADKARFHFIAGVDR